MSKKTRNIPKPPSKSEIIRDATMVVLKGNHGRRILLSDLQPILVDALDMPIRSDYLRNALSTKDSGLRVGLRTVSQT